MSHLTQKSVDDQLGRRKAVDGSYTSRIVKMKSKFKNQSFKQLIVNKLPIIQLLYNYNVGNCLLNDILAGISVGMSSIPQAMGYTSFLKVPVQFGLYSIIFPSFIYSLLTTSKHASCTINVGGVIFLNDALQSLGYNDELREEENYTRGDELSPYLDDRMKAIYTLTFLSGFVMVIGTFMKFGVIVRFSSEPHMSAIFASVTCTIILKQLPEMMGIDPNSYTGFMQTPKLFINICERIPETNVTTLIIAVVNLVVIVFVKEVINTRLVKYIRLPIPIEMIALILSTWFSSMWDWNGNHDVKITGYIPDGLPLPQSPFHPDWTDFIYQGIVVGILTYLGSPILIKHFSIKYNYDVDLDQETFGLGVTRMISSSLSCAGIGLSSPRLLMMESCGGKTQLTYIFAVFTSLGVVLFLTDYAETLPQCVVSAVIVSSFVRAFQTFSRLRKYWRQDKLFLLLWLFTFTMSLSFTVSDGILYGMGFSILVTALRAQYPEVSQTNVIQQRNKTYFVPSSKYSNSYPPLRNVKIISIDGAIFYGNSLQIKERIIKMFPVINGSNDIRDVNMTIKTPNKKISYINEGFSLDIPLPQEINRTEPVTTDIAILELSGVPFIDTTTLREMSSLQSILKNKYNITLKIAACTENIRASLSKAPVISQKFESYIYQTLEDALESCHYEDSCSSSICSFGSSQADLIPQRDQEDFKEADITELTEM